jgi:hypothetical protein
VISTKISVKYFHCFIQIDGSGRVSRSHSDTALGRSTPSGGRSRTFSASSNIADFSQDDEIQLLRAEVLSLKLETLPPSLETYENDNESISLYTGFPSYAVARLVLDLADPGVNGTFVRVHFIKFLNIAIFSVSNILDRSGESVYKRHSYYQRKRKSQRCSEISCLC